MRTLRATRVAAFYVAATVASSLWACSSDHSTGPSNQLVATWRVTSFVAGGQNAIAQGMTMSIALNDNGTYIVTVSNDLIGACDGQTNCTETGNYSSTATQLTIDPGSEDEVTFNYSIQGTTLTLTGNIDNIPVTLTLSKS